MSISSLWTSFLSRILAPQVLTALVALWYIQTDLRKKKPQAFKLLSAGGLVWYQLMCHSQRWGPTVASLLFLLFENPLKKDIILRPRAIWQVLWSGFSVQEMTFTEPLLCADHVLYLLQETVPRHEEPRAFWRFPSSHCSFTFSCYTFLKLFWMWPPRCPIGSSSWDSPRWHDRLCTVNLASLPPFSQFCALQKKSRTSLCRIFFPIRFWVRVWLYLRYILWLGTLFSILELLT